VSQSEVFGFLSERRRDWFCSSDVSLALGVSRNSANSSLKKLRSAGLVLCVPMQSERFKGRSILFYSFKK